MIGDLAQLLDPVGRRRLRAYLTWAVVYGLLSGLAAALLVPVIRDLVDGDTHSAARGLLVLAVATALACVAHYFQAMSGFHTALDVLDTMHVRIGDQLARLPLGWFDADTTGRVSRAATDGTYMVAGLFAHLLTPLIVGITAPAAVVIAMLFYDWRLGLVALCLIPLLALVARGAGRAIGHGEQIDHAATTEAGGRVIEFARHQPVLRAFGRGVDGYPPLDRALAEQVRAGRRSLWWQVGGIAAGGIVVQAILTILLVAGVWFAVHGQTDAATTVAVLALAFRFAGPLAEVSEYAGVLRMAGNDLRRITDVLHEPSLPEPETSAPFTEPGAIELDCVKFGYDPAQPVLRDVSLRVTLGTTIALVGASGSGKTTVTRLIARFWDVDRGAVRVGGVDVRELSTDALMSQLALVFQDVYLFDDTLAANIRLGRPEATDAEVREAARLAGVLKIVQRLPYGWETRVGEGGSALSGGERQRVSLARALLKDAPIVLLDEATAALDPENEQYVQQSLRQIARTSTVLVIAHRLSTVVSADRIVVLEDGVVAESGSHAELLAHDGPYAAFWRTRTRAEGWRLAAT